MPVVIAVTLSICYLAVAQVDHAGLFSEPLLILCKIALAVVILVAFLLDKKEFNETKKIQAFGASCGAVLTLLGYCALLFILERRDSSPSQIYCVTKMSDFNGVSIDFRRDGTYKLTSWSLGADIYRGNFTLNDSVITIDQAGIGLVSNRFVIRQDGEIGSAGLREKSMYQINQQGKIINRSTGFRVTEYQISK